LRRGLWQAAVDDVKETNRSVAPIPLDRHHAAFPTAPDQFLDYALSNCHLCA
jgi:hypothetical protein